MFYNTNSKRLLFIYKKIRFSIIRKFYNTQQNICNSLLTHLNYSSFIEKHNPYLRFKKLQQPSDEQKQKRNSQIQHTLTYRLNIHRTR